MDFIKSIAPFAIEHGNKNKILPSLILAQAVLESGHGKSELAKKANNLFGIKKGSGWTGAVYTIKTKEYRGGKPYSVTGEFRKYPSLEGAVADLCAKYANGLRGERVNRYATVVGEKDYKKAADAVFKSGYATDPNYPKKIVDLIQKYDLTRFDNEKQKEKERMNMKVTISSGHGKYVAGAVGYLNEVTEARRVVEQVAEHLREVGSLSAMYHENTAKNKGDNLNNIWKFHNTTNRDLDFSVHFNACKKTQDDMGVEVCYLDSSVKGLADKLCAVIAAASGLKNRGAKKRTDLGFLNYTKQPALLLEVCFVDSAADAEKYKKAFEQICRGIAETLASKKLAAEQQSKPLNKERCTISVKFSNSSSKLKEYKALLEELDLEANVVAGEAQTRIDVKFAAKSSRYGDVVAWLDQNGIKY